MINPILSAFSLVASLFMILQSRWFFHLSKPGSDLVMSLAFTYTLLVSVAYAVPYFRRIHIQRWTKFLIQIMMFTSFAWLTDVLAEHDPEALVFVALLLGATHFYATAHYFHINDDYGFVLGLLSVATSVFIHSTHRKDFKILFMFIGGFILALFTYLQHLRSEKRAESLSQDLEMQYLAGPRETLERLRENLGGETLERLRENLGVLLLIEPHVANVMKRKREEEGWQKVQKRRLNVDGRRRIKRGREDEGDEEGRLFLGGEESSMSMEEGLRGERKKRSRRL